MSNPTELEKELYEALAEVVEEIRLPFEVTKGGMVLVRFSPEQVDQIETAFKLFAVIYGQRLQPGRYVEIEAAAQHPRKGEQ